MLHEALQYLFARGQESVRSDIKMVDPRRMAIVSRDGIDWIDPPQPVKDYQLDDVQSLCDALHEFADPDKDHAVFVGLEYVRVVLDTRYSVDSLTMPLHRSDALLKLGQLSGRHSQEQAWLMLRRHYFDAIGDKGLLTAIQTLKWRSTDEGTSIVGPEVKALSRKTEAKLTGESALPESFDIDVVVYDNIPTNPITVTVQVIPLPDDREIMFHIPREEVNAAIDDAKQQVQALIDAKLKTIGIEYPVFIGSPS